MQSDRLVAVRRWLWFVAGLVVLMIVVGGATRLTGSGLSITEWRPFAGAMPPLSQAAWLAEFEKYRQIPQYQLMNKGMSLSAFQFIYWWEWGHRQLGRVVGFAFFIPYIWFVLRGTLRGKLALWLLVVGGLGGFQGAIGWLMVASGLREGMISVAPIKLALHLTTACLILTCLVWTARALRLVGAAKASLNVPHAASSARVLVGLILLQIALGALVAGSKAGLTYPTWPLMDGALVPPSAVLFAQTPWIENFVDNAALVQFNHRLTAYLLLAFAVLHWWRLRTSAVKGAGHIALAITAQACVGVLTLLLAVPLWAGLMHQFMAAVILIAAVMHAESMGRLRREAV